MKKTKIVVIIISIVALCLPVVVLAQAPQNASPKLPQSQQSSEMETNDKLLYIGFGMLIGFALSSSVSYLIRSRQGLGTEYDRFGNYGTPIHIKPEDKLANKHGTLKPPQMQNHGNRFM